MGYEVPSKVTITQTCATYTGAVAAAEKIDGVGVLGVPANSGGVVLSSGQIVAVSIKALAKNSGDIYIGGDEDGTRPYSGHGILLEPGEVWNVEVQNLNTIRLVAVISGDRVTWAALK
ncbi:MAG: hypothetical protein K6T73_07380 [Candidatus Bathyarchaeota archaeon]|nr:hypothetical protein [Candidatus Bathyarchaeota archaeon]